MEQLSTAFLPLGSMVRLDNEEIYGTRLYLVVARAIAKNEQGKIISRYKVAPHPFGYIPSEEIFSIEFGDILDVVFEGYSNETDSQFLEELIRRMTNAMANQASSVEKMTPEPQKAEEIQDEYEDEKLKEDPFYKFRKQEG